MANEKSLRTAYLCHMTPEEKKRYNAEYYREHKDYWTEYYGRKMGGGNLTGAAKIARGNAVAAAVNKKLSEGAASRITALEKLRERSDRAATILDARKQDAATKKMGLSPVHEGKRIGDWTRTDSAGNLRYDIQSPKYNLTPGFVYTNGGAYKSSHTGQSYSGALTPAVKKSKLSSMTDSAIRKGKSLLSNFTSAWKTGVSSIKSALTPKTVTNYTTYHTGFYVSPNSGNPVMIRSKNTTTKTK